MLYENQIYAGVHALFLQTEIKVITGQIFLTGSGLKKVKRLKITPKRMQSSQTQVGLLQTKELKKIMNSSTMESNMRADIQRMMGLCRNWT